MALAAERSWRRHSEKVRLLVPVELVEELRPNKLRVPALEKLGKLDIVSRVAGEDEAVRRAGINNCFIDGLPRDRVELSSCAWNVISGFDGQSGGLAARRRFD